MRTKCEQNIFGRTLASAILVLTLALAGCGGSETPDGVGVGASNGEGAQGSGADSDGGFEGDFEDANAELEEAMADLEEAVADLDPEMEEAIEGYLDELGIEGPDPDSVFAGYRFWSAGVRMSETLPGEWKDVVDNPLLDDGRVLAEQSNPSVGNNERGFQRKVVADYDSAWLFNGADEVVRAQFDSNELQTILIEDLVPAGQLRGIAGDTAALYLVVNSDTGSKANFIIELDPATGDERRRIELSTVGTTLASIDINDTHIAVSREYDEIVVVERAGLTEAYTLQVTLGKNAAVPLMTTDEIYVISPGRGEQVDLLSRFSVADGSVLEADRALPYAGLNRAFGDIVVHSNFELLDMPMYGLSPAGEQLLEALPKDLDKIHDVHIGDEFIVVGGEGPEDPDDREFRGIFFVDRATNSVVWDLQNWLASPNMDIVAPPPG